MKVQSNWLMQGGGLAVTTLTRCWMSTLEYQAAFYDPTVDSIHPRFQGPVIFLVWHEYIPFLFYLRPRSHLAMLLSRHQDAELLSQAARYMGFETVRGSSNRGGVSALREILTKSDNLSLAITPDGPRGPRRRLAQGCVYLSSRLEMPLVAVGLGYDRPWRTPTWDRFAIPRPYSRARAMISPRIQIPANLDRDGIETYRRRVERLLNRLSAEAESWATAGVRIRGQVPVRRQAAGRSSRAARVPAPPGPSPALRRSA